MATKPVALILGSGPRVGASVAAKFLANGYNVAVVSRKGDKADEGILSLKADFAEPDSVASVFEKVESEFKAAPSVVVYNAAALTPPVSKDNMFTIPADKFSSDLNVNTVSAYVAAQKAVAGWATLPKETKKTFIYTGNAAIVHTVPVPMLLNLGVGKSASAYFIEVADTLYSANGSRFFYADERHEDGKIKGMAVDGPAHADFYAQLVEHGDVPWHATFVKDKGYVQFK